MTIYWERCSICGKYHVLKQCILDDDLMVCSYCCLSCPKRSICHNPVWLPVLKVALKTEVKPRRREAEKIILDLLSRLEEGEKKG